MAAQQRYARIHNGEVFEYNLTATQIANRGDRTSQYLPVKFGFKPIMAPKYHNIAEEAHIENDHVRIEYVIRPMGLQALLMYVHYVNGDNKQPRGAITIGDVEPALVQAIAAAATVEVQRMLDRFARTRNYDNITTAITYRNSPVPSFATEGVRANDVRDLSWAGLYQYLQQVTAGTLPVPKSVDDIISNVPAMTWA